MPDAAAVAVGTKVLVLASTFAESTDEAWQQSILKSTTKLQPRLLVLTRKAHSQKKCGFGNAVMLVAKKTSC